MYAYAHWWSKIHYRYGEKGSIDLSKDMPRTLAIDPSPQFNMDTTMTDLTVLRLSGAAQFFIALQQLKVYISITIYN